MVRYSPYMLLQKKGPDGVMWIETDYHKQRMPPMKSTCDGIVTGKQIGRAHV